jgi:predicted HicB family RNase H-like nuclease
MKSYLLSTLTLIFAFVACTPPEEVRLQDYTEIAESGYFAHVSAGLSFCSLALGESLVESEGQLNLRLELNDTEKAGYKIAQFRVRNTELDADTIVTCGFKNGRLSAVVSNTVFGYDVESSQKLIDQLSSVYDTVENLKTNFNTAESANFWKVDDVVSVQYKFLQNQSGFNGLQYTIAYTSEIEVFQNLINS